MNYSNETIKSLYERGSVRSFEEKDIPDEVLKEIINAGCHSATGGNLQPYSIISIRSREQKKALMDTGTMQSIVEKAPVSLLFMIDWHRIERWAKSNHAPYSAMEGFRHFWIAFQDTIIAAQNICTAADSLGLGSVYLGTVESCFDELKPMFNLPKGVFPVVIVSLGYPKKKPESAPKLFDDVIVHNETYKEIPIDELNRQMDRKYAEKQNPPLSDKNIKKLFQVTKEIDGEQAANTAVDYAKGLGHIHMAQRYFALHYPADWSRTGNSDFLKSLKNYGYNFVDGINH